jgi:pimeloyl-ACP methyl ester carboxylesterase
LPVRRSFVVIVSSWLLLFAAASRSAADGGDQVVLLHGLGRSHWSMMPLEARLEDAGFGVTNLGYPSTELDPDGLVAYVESAVAECCSGAARLHFVTHSLGGILVRGFLAKHRPANLGRVVMLAPPNRGSELVDELVEWPLFSWILGPTAAQLGTNSGSFPNRLPPVDFDLGVIAGTESLNPIGSAMLPEGNDGTVSVASTRVEGMRDFVAVPASHTFIMWSDYAADQVVEYLRNGRFDRENAQEK